MSTAVTELPRLSDGIKEERARRHFLTDPCGWVRRRLNEFVWSGQGAILESVRDHRRTAVASCHEAGKSYIAARAAAWWLDIHPPGQAFVVTSAPTGKQVKAILWKEIRRAHAKGLRGRTNQQQWFMDVPLGDEEEVAFGRKPSDYDPTAFQGIHARWVLVIFDEACGIPNNEVTHSLWDAADSLIANDESRILAIGNPDDPTSEFEAVCRPGSGWNTINISAFDTPNFTGEEVPKNLSRVLVGRTWVEEKRKKWAPDWTWTDDGTRCIPPEGKAVTDSNPLWQSKVLGVFPENAVQGGLIPISWVHAAQMRELKPGTPIELGVDVGAGGDSSCIAARKGPVVRIVHEDHNPDTMQTCGNVVSFRRKTKATKAKIDKIGIGAGVTDRGVEQGEPFVGINVGAGTSDPEEYLNLRAELWWGIRDRFETGDIDLDPLDDDTAAELCSLKYKRTSRGQIQIESKLDAMRRGVPSPNRAEAVMLCFAPEPKEEDNSGGFLF